ncbi:MAG: outer membrane beta-barrel protein [Rhodothermales bacterium]
MRLALVLALFVSLALPAAAQRCDTALAEADEQYRAGYFDDVIERLSDCLDANAFSSEERRRAYRLLGLSYIGKDRELDAREAVRSLLEVAPDYQPDPALDPPPFVQLVEEMNRPRPTPSAPAASPASTVRPVSTTSGFMGSLSALGTGYSDSDDDSANGAGGYLTLGYGFTPAIAVVFQLGGASFSDFSEIGEATLGNVGVGGRYHFGGGQRKLVPFVGAGASFQSLSLDFDASLGGGSDEYSGAGGSLEGGLLYFLSPAFALDGGVQALFSSLTSDESDRSISTTVVHFGVGVSWSPGR